MSLIHGVKVAENEYYKMSGEHFIRLDKIIGIGPLHSNNPTMKSRNFTVFMEGRTTFEFSGSEADGAALASERAKLIEAWRNF